MICFQLLVSLVFWTTQKRWSPCNRSLWFAFNYWYLWYSEQLIQISNQITLVVICFQLLVSLVFWTTPVNSLNYTKKLWFAFNYWYLWYSEQLNTTFTGTKDVVICFQLLVSLVFWTTLPRGRNTGRRLWFAFNYWYLWYSEQQADRH